MINDGSTLSRSGIMKDGEKQWGIQQFFFVFILMEWGFLYRESRLAGILLVTKTWEFFWTNLSHQVTEGYK